MRNSA